MSLAGANDDAHGEGATASAMAVRLANLVVLDVMWLAEVLTCVVTQHSDKTQHIPDGQLHYKDLRHVWRNYHRELWEPLVHLLFALQVAYPAFAADGRTTEPFCIVPCMLPVEVPVGVDASWALPRERTTVGGVV